MANLAGKRSNYNLSDLQIKIVSLIASVSITDLFNVTRTCKSLHQAGTHPIVPQNAAVLAKFYAVHTRKFKTHDGFAQFVRQCVNNNNPEAMLCLQMAEYFLSNKKLYDIENERNKEEAIRNLKTADAKGHAVAKALCGVFYLMAGGGED